ncbi:MAG: Arc/MetJ-type ribon-helix-helix transcriptional regulator [Candidatus Azotimanducaceae bacterium]|jgi:Arc/MetJ-type ribon-helix-helix transcriptional regulator
MTTISVPLNPALEKHLDDIVADTGASRAAVMRKALEKLAEDRAVNAVLVAEQEYSEGKGLTGDLADLLKQTNV